MPAGGQGRRGRPRTATRGSDVGQLREDGDGADLAQKGRVVVEGGAWGGGGEVQRRGVHEKAARVR